MTITHGNSLQMLNSTYNAWSDSVNNITSHFSSPGGLTWSISFEPVPPAVYLRNTNNALGLSDREGTLIVTLLTAIWTDSAQDDVVKGTAETLFRAIQSKAEDLAEYDSFLYLNYANTAAWQGNPIKSYGEESVARLKSTAKKVDSHGFFQKRVPGGFKLD